MRVFLIFSLLFSAAMCGLVPSWWPSLVHRQPDNESSLTERASLLLRGSKDVSPEKLNRWLSKVEVLDGIYIIIISIFILLLLIYTKAA